MQPWTQVKEGRFVAAAYNEFHVLIYQLNIRSHYNQLTTAQATQLIQSLLAIERAQGCIQ